MGFRISFYIILVICLLASCKEDEVSYDPGYAYFPLEFGRYVSYDVDSIFIDSEVNVNDTSRFQIKERIDSTFIDAEGRDAARLQRFFRPEENAPWTLRDVWTITRTSTRAEKYEENVRYVRMAFGVNADQRWDGNAFNTLEEWEYHYEGIGRAATIGDLSYNDVVDVIQIADSNLIEKKVAKEIYARDIGMVFKQLDILELVIATDSVRFGSQLKMVAFDHGVE